MSNFPLDLALSKQANGTLANLFEPFIITITAAKCWRRGIDTGIVIEIWVSLVHAVIDSRPVALKIALIVARHTHTHTV